MSGSVARGASLDVRAPGATVATLARERLWTAVVSAAMAGWAVVLSALVHSSYTDFRLGRFDLGNMVQAVWNTSEGRLLEATEGATGEQVTRLASHVDPFLVLLTPLWMVWPSPLALAFAQIAVVSLGALPVLWLAKRRLAQRAAGVLALAYLAYPWLAWSALGVHPVTFAIPLLLFCIWFLDSDRLVLFAVCAALVLSTGELMGLPIAALGLWFALARARPLAGAAIAFAGAAWTFLSLYVIVPAARGEGSAFYGFYDEVGGSPQGVLRTLVSDPGVVLGALVESHDVAYVVLLSLPLVGLFLLTPGLALVALPQLLANGLSDFRSMTDPRYHSVAAIVPFLVAATVLGIARLPRARQVPTAVLVLVVSAALAVVLGPWLRIVGVTPLGGRAPLAEARVEALREAVALVPERVPVSASNAAGAHLSARRYVYSIPVLGKAQWVLVDAREPWITQPGSPILVKRPAAVRAFVRKLERDPAWRRIFRRDGVVVFRSALRP